MKSPTKRDWDIAADEESIKEMADIIGAEFESMPKKGVVMHGKNVSTVVYNIMKFTNRKFPKEFETAMKEYSRSYGRSLGFSFENKTLYTENDQVIQEFTAWFILERIIKKTGATPAELYMDSEIPKMWEIAVISNLLSFRTSIFEIIWTDGRNYRVRDIVHEDVFEIRTIDMPQIESKLIDARIVPFDDEKFFFYGLVKTYNEEEKFKKEILSKIKDIRDMNDEQKSLFIEYFGCPDPEFKMPEEAIEALKNFTLWQHKKKGGIDSDSPPVTSSCIINGERIGLVFTEGGINIVPFYGYIKDTISGNWKNVRDWKKLLDQVVYDGELISDSSLRFLIECNKKTALEVMKMLNPDITDYESMIKDIKAFRPYFLSKEVPHISFVDKQDTSQLVKKTGRNEPCPCGSGRKYKKCHMNDLQRDNL